MTEEDEKYPELSNYSAPGSQLGREQENAEVLRTREAECSPAVDPGEDREFCTIHVAHQVFVVEKRFSRFRWTGSGAWGSVLMVESQDGQRSAIKKLRHTFESPDTAKKVLREVRLLRHLRHENIISIEDVYCSGGSRDSYADVYIRMEAMDADLHSVLSKEQKLTETHHRFFMHQLIRGLLYLHDSEVLHRDIKPSNLLVNQNCDLKIADFGLARIKPSAATGTSGSSPSNASVKLPPHAPQSEKDKERTAEDGLRGEETLSRLTSPVGDQRTLPQQTGLVATRWYRAPELLWESDGVYDEKVDIWSAGCVLAEMLNNGKPLFPGKSEAEQLQLILSLLGPPAPETVHGLSVTAARRINKSATRAEPPIVSKGTGTAEAEASSRGVQGKTGETEHTAEDRFRASLERHKRRRANLRTLFPSSHPDCLDLLAAMLAVDPAERPSAADCLRHRWLAVDWEESDDEGEGVGEGVGETRHSAPPSARRSSGIGEREEEKEKRRGKAPMWKDELKKRSLNEEKPTRSLSGLPDFAFELKSSQASVPMTARLQLLGDFLSPSKVSQERRKEKEKEGEEEEGHGKGGEVQRKLPNHGEKLRLPSSSSHSIGLDDSFPCTVSYFRRELLMEQKLWSRRLFQEVHHDSSSSSSTAAPSSPPPPQPDDISPVVSPVDGRRGLTRGFLQEREHSNHTAGGKSAGSFPQGQHPSHHTDSRKKEAVRGLANNPSGSCPNDGVVSAPAHREGVGGEKHQSPSPLSFGLPEARTPPASANFATFAAPETQQKIVGKEFPEDASSSSCGGVLSLLSNHPGGGEKLSPSSSSSGRFPTPVPSFASFSSSPSPAKDQSMGASSCAAAAAAVQALTTSTTAAAAVQRLTTSTTAAAAVATLAVASLSREDTLQVKNRKREPKRVFNQGPPRQNKNCLSETRHERSPPVLLHGPSPSQSPSCGKDRRSLSVTVGFLPHSRPHRWRLATV
uniref:Protein kinase domain-containing protein n=1 Tax=Chromera velia CCMP2878 TaxID=1169474 RepID=A0A0G4FVG5_9ALVE|eukprot:Cvel_3774.t1-p1 / transcript=Cvel_3774.t1 / gene=Cvel_3774 / organism=Chromera_velia_CCMP2878 / gene_product=Mitogen-activated protein kinase 7, putative / transcript_product=Mitogen-activated protein kinase 7, putative / location=Cvel_scaffold158:39997-43506(+) / protein_length=969 / sequence_SO=supercontig / SO=protein_coding / is_pseudo=false